ncbi:MAG: hypothetical protein RL226_94 [Bacteroidota bacterium]|jgi:hypothetical protein
MNELHKYDPEDIEALLFEKTFGELYPEEKEFVLRHVADESEYNELRKTLLVLKSQIADEGSVEPGNHVRRNAMEAFRQTKKRKQWFSLNFFSFSLNIDNFNPKPVLYLGVVALLFGGVFWFMSSSPDATGLLAEHHSINHNQRNVATDGETIVPEEMPPSPASQESIVIADQPEELRTEVSTLADDVAETKTRATKEEDFDYVDQNSFSGISNADAVITTNSNPSVPIQADDVAFSAIEEMKVPAAAEESIEVQTIAAVSKGSSAGAASPKASQLVVSKKWFEWTKAAY